MANTENWVKQDYWHGNPSLGYQSFKKIFINPYTRRKVPVFVWGKDSIYYTVSAGPDSDYSYTGCFYPGKPTIEEVMQKVDTLYNEGKLFK